MITGVFGEQEIPGGKSAQNQSEKHRHEKLAQFALAVTRTVATIK